ncbi:hypothetical protein GQ607_015179 [Colletotrichum asianum]|uniref:Secreted protein n=1 Tax=Colletotrichum asianum TaxID=702518 RepID=A0A8H3ZFU1_9PEZI|nr:hypothetical protein GQ607_015179 [Colletotrichum asianum]
MRLCRSVVLGTAALVDICSLTIPCDRPSFIPLQSQFGPSAFDGSTGLGRLSRGSVRHHRRPAYRRFTTSQQHFPAPRNSLFRAVNKLTSTAAVELLKSQAEMDVPILLTAMHNVDCCQLPAGTLFPGCLRGTGGQWPFDRQQTTG